MTYLGNGVSAGLRSIAAALGCRQVILHCCHISRQLIAARRQRRLLRPVHLQVLCQRIAPRTPELLQNKENGP